MCLTPPQSNVFTFLQQNKFFVARTDPSDFTHVSQDGMGGGKISIPASYMDEFMIHMANDLDTGVPLYLSEKLSPLFRFFLDMDLNKSLTSLEGSLLDQLVSICTAVITTFYPGIDNITKSVVMTREESANCHIVFPFLMVDSLRAKFLCMAIRRALRERLGENQPWYNKGSLEDTVDALPYENMLRMMGNSKSARCKCLSPEADCETCAGARHVHIGLEYSVTHAYVAALPSDTLLEEVTASTHETLKWTSLRQDNVLEPTSGFCAKKMAQEMKLLLKTGDFNNERQDSRNARRDMAKKHKKKLAKECEWTDLPKAGNEKIWGVLHMIIDESDSLYQGTRIESVSMNYPRHATMYIVRTNRTKCLNLDTPSREHNSETTSFKIAMHNKKVTPKCGCKCQTTENRKNGSRCMDYEAPGTAVAVHHLFELFPHNCKLPTISASTHRQILAAGQYYRSTGPQTEIASEIKVGDVVFPCRKRKAYHAVSTKTTKQRISLQENQELEKARLKLVMLNKALSQLRSIKNNHELRRHRPSKLLHEVQPGTAIPQAASEESY